MWVDILLGVAPLIMPYTIFGENLSSIILSLVGILYLISNKSKAKVNKKFLIVIISLNIIAISSTIFISPNLESLSGFCIYLNIFVYYIAYSKSIDDKNKKNIIKYMVFAIGFFAVYYILIQGFYYGIRIYGNIGYANSYALLLLSGIYFNRIREQDKYADIIEMIFILGIFYTGSRTTLILAVIYLLVRIITESKKTIDNVINILEGFLWGLIQYVIYSSLGLKSLIVMPVILFIYFGMKNSKLKKYVYGFLVLFSIAILLVGTNNTLQRIRNISINNGSLQERFVFFEDTMNSIIKEPLGNGINTFQYKSYEGATAFYDVKYVHNSLLQVTFDMGVIGGLLFLIIIIIGFKLMLKQNKNILSITLYASIVIHSLLDFDMSYSTFGILLVMIVTLNSKEEEILDLKFKNLVTIPMAIILVYLGVFEGSIALGKSLLVNNKTQASNSAFTMANNISFDLDYRGYFNEAQGYKKLYDENNDEGYLNEALDLLTKSNKINKDDPRILWNITYIYMKLDNEEKVLEYMEELLTRERYNKEVYSLYYDYFNEKKELKKEEKYSIILDIIKAKQEDSLKKLNAKSVYMNNQLN